MSGDPRLWWLAGADAADIAAQLDRVGDGAPPVPAPEAGPARMGIVDPDERKLRLARRLLQEGGPWRGRSDIWYSPSGLVRGGGKVAFLFPGVEPTFGLDEVDLPALGARFGLMAPLIEDDTIAHRTASIYRTGNFLDAVARRIGVVPDLIAGHSIGEWSGTVASGIVPVAHAEDLLGAVDLSAVELPDLDFAAFAAGVGPVAEVVAELHDIVVSHDNSPGQSIVCGTPAMVEEALARMRGRNVLGYRLGFQSGFHTPAMEESLPEFRAHLERMEVRPATIPLWSATSVAPYPETAEEIIELHLRHLMEPVRFRPMVDRLYEDAGARVFVQVGVGSLTSFVTDTLGERDHVTVPFLTPRRTALAQVHRAVTALWVEGVDVRPDALRPPADTAPSRQEPAPARVSPAAPAAVAAGVRGGVALPPPMPLAAAADMLATAARAGQDVLDALSARVGRATAAAPAPTPAPPPPVAVSPAEVDPGDEILPWAPTPPRPWPTGRTTVRRLLSLDTMPETYDHTLYPAPEDWPDVADRFPIVAMTTQLQLLEDIAAQLRRRAGRRRAARRAELPLARHLRPARPRDHRRPQGRRRAQHCPRPVLPGQRAAGAVPGRAAPPRGPTPGQRAAHHPHCPGDVRPAAHVPRAAVPGRQSAGPGGRRRDAGRLRRAADRPARCWTTWASSSPTGPSTRAASARRPCRAASRRSSSMRPSRRGASR